MGKRKQKAQKAKGKNNKNDQDFPKKKGRRGKGKTKPSKGWTKHLDEFQNSIKSLGVYIRDVDGDGNCLFRSVADQLEGDENQHAKYRTLAVEYIKKRKNHFGMFLEEDENIEEYVKEMEEDGTWGGHFELIALSAVLGVRFCIYLKDEDPMIVRAPSKIKGLKFVHVAFHADALEHYSSVRKVGDESQEAAQPILNEFIDKIPEDDSDDDDENDEEKGIESDKSDDEDEKETKDSSTESEIQSSKQNKKKSKLSKQLAKQEKKKRKKEKMMAQNHQQENE